MLQYKLTSAYKVLDKNTIGIGVIVHSPTVFGIRYPLGRKPKTVMIHSIVKKGAGDSELISLAKEWIEENLMDKESPALFQALETIKKATGAVGDTISK
jgi:hypothetical protein